MVKAEFHFEHTKFQVQMEYPDGAVWQRAGNKGMELSKVNSQRQDLKVIGKVVLVETTGFINIKEPSRGRKGGRETKQQQLGRGN